MSRMTAFRIGVFRAERLRPLRPFFCRLQCSNIRIFLGKFAVSQKEGSESTVFQLVVCGFQPDLHPVGASPSALGPCMLPGCFSPDRDGRTESDRPDR